MDGRKIQLEIIKTEPEAVYRDTIYDQTVIGLLSDGTEILLFDPTPMSIEHEMVGDTVEASIYILAKSGVRRAPNESVGVYPPTARTGKWSHDFIGDVSEIDLDNGIIVLDIGVGEVTVGFIDEIERMIASDKIDRNTRLYIPGQRTDIDL